MGERFKLELLDAIPAGRAGHALPPGRLVRPLPRPARAVDGPDRRLQADQGRRRLLARRRAATRSCSASTAPRSRPRRSSTPTCTSRRRRSGATIASSAARWTCSTSRRRRRARCSGTRTAGRCGGRSRTTSAAGSTRAGYVEVKTPQLYDRVLWERSGHWDKFRENMFTLEAEERHLRAQADELPGPRADLQPGPAQLPRSAVAPGRVRRLPSQRAVRRAARHHAGARLHPGRRAHLLHARADHGRERRVLRAADAGLPGFRLRPTCG